MGLPYDKGLFNAKTDSYRHLTLTSLLYLFYFDILYFLNLLPSFPLTLLIMDNILKVAETLLHLFFIFYFAIFCKLLKKFCIDPFSSLSF